MIEAVSSPTFIEEPPLFIPHFEEPIKPKTLVISPCSFATIRPFVEKHHYTHGIGGGSILYCFRMDFRDYIVGAAVFGRPCLPSWTKFNLEPQQVLELRRLVLLDEVGRNSESYVIGHMLRWIRRNVPVVKAVVSYADPNHGHDGTIYKASNFHHDGMTSPGTVFVDTGTGKSFHNRSLTIKRPFADDLRRKNEQGLLVRKKIPGKHRYVYFFDRIAR